MNESVFRTKDARIIYNTYIEHAKDILVDLSSEDIIDIISEIDSHIFESYNANSSIESEKERIEIVINKLGDPESYLKPIIVEKQLHYAVNKYNFMGIFKGICSIILTGSQYTILCLMYLFILAGGVVVIAKFLYPHNTGLFVDKGEFIGLGYISQINQEAVDLLGYWLIPIMIIAIILFYYLMTFILKQVLHFKNKVD